MSIRTIRYCDPAAGGGGDGSSGNPWTLAEAVANAAGTNAIYVRPGTYSLSASITIAGSSQLWVGVDGSDNPVGWWDSATFPAWDFGGGAYSVNIAGKNYDTFYGIRVTNTSTHGFNITADSVPSAFINCVVDSCGGTGFVLGNAGKAFFCKSDGNGVGFSGSGQQPLAYKCHGIDSATNFDLDGGHVLDCVSTDTGTNTTNHIAVSTGKLFVVGNSIHGSGAAGSIGVSGAGFYNVVFNNLIDAVETGITGGTYNLFANNSVYGATTPYTTGANNLEINDVTTDPQFADPEALDFSIGEATFKGHFSPININLGADQADSGGGAGGGGAGSIFGSLIQVRG